MDKLSVSETRRELLSTREALEKARSAVYRAAYPSRNVPLSKCRDMASDAVRSAYDNALEAHYAAEGRAIRDGHCYMGSAMLLFWVPKGNRSGCVYW